MSHGAALSHEKALAPLLTPSVDPGVLMGKMQSEISSSPVSVFFSFLFWTSQLSQWPTPPQNSAAAAPHGSDAAVRQWEWDEVKVGHTTSRSDD